MNRARFEELVTAALDELPADFQERLDNVDVVIEDWPAPVQVRRMRLRYREELLGLYEGIPRTERGQSYGLVPPDKITIFQKPIEARCRSDDEIKLAVRDTVLHEIAHHFGSSERTLRDIERKRPRKREKP